MEALVEERGLYVLRLSSTNRPEPDSMACVLRRGGEPLIDEWTAPQTSLGLPAPGSQRKGERRDPARNAQLEPQVEAFFRGLVDLMPPDEPLWIELRRPKGGLVYLPWERWLTPIFERPVLRLPRFALQPVRIPDRTLHIAYCSSAPRAKSPVPVGRLMLATLEALRSHDVEAVLHLFVDEELAGKVYERAKARDLAERIEVYRAPDESERTESYAERSPLSNPWLRWMADALHGRSIDLVHFANHGYLARGRGSLAFARSPRVNDDPAWARFVDAGELTHFLDLTGAAGLLLTSPPRNFSAAGLLALADEVVSTRPGPVVLHDAEQDPEGDDLGTALGFLVDRGAPAPTAAVSQWIHPDRWTAPRVAMTGGPSGLESMETPRGPETPATQAKWKTLYARPAGETTTASGAEREIETHRILDDFTLAKAVRKRRRRKITRPRRGLESMQPRSGDISSSPADEAGDEPVETPAWMRSSQRILERHAAKLAATELADSEDQQAAQKGAADGLRFIAEVLGDDEEDG